jgi:hypothetical protein
MSNASARRCSVYTAERSKKHLLKRRTAPEGRSISVIARQPFGLQAHTLDSTFRGAVNPISPLARRHRQSGSTTSVPVLDEEGLGSAASFQIMNTIASARLWIPLSLIEIAFRNAR